MEPDQGSNFPEWFDFIAAIDKPGNFCGFGLSVILTDFKILLMATFRISTLVLGVTVRQCDYDNS